jgi:L-lactate utilization protein LutC
MAYDTVATDEQINAAVQTLAANGMKAVVAQTAEEAKKIVLDMLPKGAEILTATSKTLEALGLDTIINESGEYDAVKPKLQAMWGDESKKRDQRKLGTAPDYVVGSVHAITEDGVVLVASNTGSQLPAYAYGAGAVIWVVGAQKIVPNLEEAHKRLETHTLPLESERARQAYGTEGSNISKLLVVSKEVTPERITIIVVKQTLGF